jgi:hypothetical protein
MTGNGNSLSTCNAAMASSFTDGPNLFSAASSSSVTRQPSAVYSLGVAQLPVAALAASSGIVLRSYSPTSAAPSANQNLAAGAAAPFSELSTAPTGGAGVFSAIALHGLEDAASLGQWVAAGATAAVATAFALNETDRRNKGVPGLVYSIRR